MGVGVVVSVVVGMSVVGHDLMLYYNIAGVHVWAVRSLPHGSSFRDGPKDQTRNLEIPGSMLRIAPE